jgi:uncharacterized phage-associated protein
MQLSFSYKKAVQSLNYFALKDGGSLNKMKALKLIYFADRYHLRKYGRPITNDTYFALTYGPVASACRNLLEDEIEYKSPESTYKQLFVKVTDKYNYQSIHEVKQEVFSQSDLEALQYAWETYSNKNHFALADETHRFPEWSKHEAALKSGQVSRRPMPYSDFLENPEAGVEILPALSREDQDDLREEIAELHAIEGVWA